MLDAEEEDDDEEDLGLRRQLLALVFRKAIQMTGSPARVAQIRGLLAAFGQLDHQRVAVDVLFVELLHCFLRVIFFVELLLLGGGLR